MTTSVLVTGGAGYIGSHTCKTLAAAGFLPVTIDNLSTGHREFVKWGPLIEGDIHDTDLVARAIQRHRVCGVIHFAANALVGESVLQPEKYYGNNFLGTFRLLEGMREANCEVIVFSSTCAVYGVPTTSLIDEDLSKNPINPYGASKLFVERMLSDYSAAYGLRFIALRYFNACGADASGELGELREHETHLIPRALVSLLQSNSEFIVHGTDYPTPDGTAVRDYVHVTDLADAHVSALQRLLTDGFSGVFNLGTGEGKSVREVLSTIERVTGRSVQAFNGPRRPGDPPMLVADPARAISELSFQAKRSDLITIIKSAWAWHLRVAKGRKSALSESTTSGQG